MDITDKEKCELLKNTIIQMYSKEGRSKSYISRILEINRNILTEKINNEWKLEQAKPYKHLTPSLQKFVNKNRQKIKSMLDRDIDLIQIRNELGVDYHTLYTVCENDEVLRKAYSDYNNRMSNKTDDEQTFTDNPLKQNNVEDLHGEEWRPILGYDGYFASNFGRVKRCSSERGDSHLIVQVPNVRSGYIYVSLVNNKGKHKNLSLGRVIGHTFLSTYDDEHNTINHIDGDKTNNRVDNLEWVSQSENNKHAFDVLKRCTTSKRYEFSKIVYKDKYEFKTIAALARFIGKSQTQVRRYIDDPKHTEIVLVN